MATVILVLAVFLVVWGALTFLRRRGHGIVARRGTSIGADLGTMADRPRMRVETVLKAGSDTVRLVLVPEAETAELDLLVALNEDEFGYEQLHAWKRDRTWLAVVLPPASRIVRLRSTEDLQPLTLRRVDDG